MHSLSDIPRSFLKAVPSCHVISLLLSLLQQVFLCQFPFFFFLFVPVSTLLVATSYWLASSVLSCNPIIYSSKGSMLIIGKPDRKYYAVDDDAVTQDDDAGITYLPVIHPGFVIWSFWSFVGSACLLCLLCIHSYVLICSHLVVAVIVLSVYWVHW